MGPLTFTCHCIFDFETVGVSLSDFFGKGIFFSMSESSEPAPGGVTGAVGVVLVPSASVGAAQGRQSWQDSLYVGVTHAASRSLPAYGLGLKT